MTELFVTDSALPSSTAQFKSFQANRLELRLVYRTLRLISDWALEYFYSDFYVEGADNVSEHGALILTPCHHNDSIDIAALSATVPHRRFVSYWAKASLFKNPVSRFILISAGSIPVARISDKKLNNQEEGSNINIAHTQETLFGATYDELAKGGAFGVFPEGASYTMPRILQVKEGAARAALGFMRKFPHKDLDLVPVGIVYTNKSRYRSRLIIHYGEKMALEPFISTGTIPGTPEEKEVVGRLTNEIEKRMLELTINTNTWDILHASRTARDILWPGDSLPLPLFVPVSKALIDIFELIHPDELLSTLIRYQALQYHTGVAHEHTTHLPITAYARTHAQQRSASLLSIPYLLAQIIKLGSPLLVTLPIHLSQLNAYIFGSLAASILAKQEEESVAQYKVIIGGVGRGIGAFLSGSLCWSIMKICFSETTCYPPVLANVGDQVQLVLARASSFLPDQLQTRLAAWSTTCVSTIGKAVSSILRFSSTQEKLSGLIASLIFAWLLLKGHSWVIDADLQRYNRLRATLLILRGRLAKARSISDTELRPYLSTPPPLPNPHIAKAVAKDPFLSMDGTEAQNSSQSEGSKGQRPKRIPRSTLVKYLLHERTEAVDALHRFLSGSNALAIEGLTEIECTKVDNAIKLVKEHCDFF